MSLLRVLGIAVVAVLVFSGTSSAQFLFVGDPSVGLADMTSGGKPNTLVIEGLTDIRDYAFDGSDLEVSFALNGSAAQVWLIIYTSGLNPPLTIEGEGPAPHKDPEHPTGGWHVYEGVDVLVYKSAGQRFGEGDNTITWNGRDMAGDVVPSGSYHLFLAAFDDEAVPHIVGNVFPKGGRPGVHFISPEKSLLYHPGNGYWCNMEKDWVADLQGWDLVDISATQDAGAGRENFGGTPTAGTPLNADYTEWIGNYNGPWISRWTMDWEARRVAPVEDWGADEGYENGTKSFADMLSGSQTTTGTNPEKTIVYATGGPNSAYCRVIGVDVATGAVVRDFDVTDLFLSIFTDADVCGGPLSIAKLYNAQPDPAGLTLTGHQSSVVARLDYDTGNVKWMNRNGDGFGDQKLFSEGEFGDYTYGHYEAPAFKYSLYSAPHGWVTYPEAGTDNVNYGGLLGGDGSGLFKFVPKKIPHTWPSYVTIVDGDDGDFDGVYMSVGGFAEAGESNDWVAEGDTGWPPYLPLAQFPYDQKRVELGQTATAVLALHNSLPENFELNQNVPNPFNPETVIRFSLPWVAPVVVNIFNEQGQFVVELVNEQLGPGEFEVNWNGTDASGAQVASGVYFYRIEAPNLRMSKKMTFLK